MRERMSRRDFLARTSVAILGTGIAADKSFGIGNPPEQTSRVIEVFHPGAVLENRRIDGGSVREMLDRGMRRLTGKAKPWPEYFKPGDRIGLKINTLGRPVLVTHRELVDAIVRELVTVGVQENNIIVWDRWEHHMTAGGYGLNTSAQGVRCYATEGRGVTPKRYDDGVFYESDLDNPDQREGGTASRFSSIFTRDCDKVINLAILKDHNTSGYTMCLKNLAYGITTNNSRFHGPAHIGPFIAGVCAHPIVARKTVLHIIDGLEACYDQGPVPDGPQTLFAPKTLWIGTDPVALDALTRGVLDEERVRRGLPLLKDTPGFQSGMRPVDHVELAAAKGVGVAELGRIKIERVG